MNYSRLALVKIVKLKGPACPSFPSGGQSHPLPPALWEEIEVQHKNLTGSKSPYSGSPGCIGQ